MKKEIKKLLAKVVLLVVYFMLLMLAIYSICAFVTFYQHHIILGTLALIVFALNSTRIAYIINKLV